MKIRTNLFLFFQRKKRSFKKNLNGTPYSELKKKEYVLIITISVCSVYTHFQNLFYHIESSCKKSAPPRSKNAYTISFVIDFFADLSLALKANSRKYYSTPAIL